MRKRIEMQGLPGIRQKPIPGMIVNTVNVFDEGLREVRAVMTAAPLGEIHVWRDDDGFFRGERTVCRAIMESHRFGAKKLALEWVKNQLPKILGEKMKDFDFELIILGLGLMAMVIGLALIGVWK